uniref:ATR n=1 Tax=Arundo donax TaxID=35708 RepID=A0A0A9ACF6_ARUDO
MTTGSKSHQGCSFPSPSLLTELEELGGTGPTPQANFSSSCRFLASTSKSSINFAMQKKPFSHLGHKSITLLYRDLISALCFCPV